MKYPVGVLGNKILESIYTFNLKAKNMIDRINAEKAQLQADLVLLKADYEAKKLEIETIRLDVEKAKQDIDGLKPREG